MFDVSAPFRSLLGSIPSSSLFPSFLHLAIHFSLHAFKHASLHPWILLSIFPYVPAPTHPFLPSSFHPLAPSLVRAFFTQPFLDPPLHPFSLCFLLPLIAGRLQSWPGGLREAINNFQRYMFKDVSLKAYVYTYIYICVYNFFHS